jgi:hypothetical protein
MKNQGSRGKVGEKELFHCDRVVSQRRIRSASCSQSRTLGPRRKGISGMRSRSEKKWHALSPSSSPCRLSIRVAHLRRPRANLSHTSGLQNLPRPPGHERAARSRTFHSSPDESRPVRHYQRSTRYLSPPTATLPVEQRPFPRSRVL